MKERIKKFFKENPEAAQQIIIDGVIFGTLAGIAAIFAYQSGQKSMRIVDGGPGATLPDGSFDAFYVIQKNGTRTRFYPPTNQ